MRPLPPIAPWFPGEDLSRLWGASRKSGEPDPTTWREVRDTLARIVRFDIEQRWRDLASMDLAFADLASEMGEPMVHTDLIEPIARLRRKLLQLHAAAQVVTGAFPFPAPLESDIELAQGRIPWDEIRAKKDPPGDPRRWMREAERAELEAAEAAWAESIR